MRLLGADGDDRLGGQGCGVLEPPLLEVDRAVRAVQVHPHVRLHPVVAHRQEGGLRPPPHAQRPGDLGQRVAGVEHLPTDEVGGQVAVAEPEPHGRHAVRLELLLGVERLAPAAAAAPTTSR
jgi:hypothetical protein